MCVNHSRDHGCYIPRAMKYEISELSANYAFMHMILFSEKMAIISINGLNRFVSTLATKRVYCDVETECLNIFYLNFMVQMLNIPEFLDML
jgi:hypothetical protein